MVILYIKKKKKNKKKKKKKKHNKTIQLNKDISYNLYLLKNK